MEVFKARLRAQSRELNKFVEHSTFNTWLCRRECVDSKEDNSISMENSENSQSLLIKCSVQEESHLQT